MLQSVDVGVQQTGWYEESCGRDAIAALRSAAAPLRGASVVHLSATPYGGGVAEILRSEIPLLRDLGLRADWKLITGDEAFFRVTKTIHNGLQGAARDLTDPERETYLTHSVRNARLLEEQYDVVVVHDPQPMALLHFHGNGTAKWAWRCHIDTSEPNPDIWAFLRPFLSNYDAAIFTLGDFVPPDLPIARQEVMPPAIDPESPKNMDFSDRAVGRLLGWIGVEADSPLLVQVSRFDPWKDPLGVIAVYRLVREHIPGLQLALVGSMALDDPEGLEIYHQIQGETADDPQVHLFTNLTGVGNAEVNAFQRAADVVVQKSIREGFGLVVSETLWKGTPVVAGRAGGIPLQMGEVGERFLVDSVEQCAESVLHLFSHPEEGREFGRLGRARVRDNFLLPRLITDELKLYASLLGVT